MIQVLLGGYRSGDFKDTVLHLLKSGPALLNLSLRQDKLRDFERNTSESDHVIQL